VRWVKWSEIRLLGGNLGRREGKGWVFIFFLSPKGSIMVGGWVFFFPPSFKKLFLRWVEGGCDWCSGTWGFFLSKIAKILHILGSILGRQGRVFLFNSKGVVFWVKQGSLACSRECGAKLDSFYVIYIISNPKFIFHFKLFL